jgi:TetR/AcrR family transcriptional repressor of nem operon
MDRIFGDTSQSPLHRLINFTENAKNGMVKFDFKRGCLIGNLGQELAALDTQFRERLEGVLLTWEQRVSDCLSEAIDLGELASGQDPKVLSRFFWVGWEGAILRSKLMRSLEPINQFTSIYFGTVLIR